MRGRRTRGAARVAARACASVLLTGTLLPAQSGGPVQPEPLLAPIRWRDARVVVSHGVDAPALRAAMPPATGVTPVLSTGATGAATAPPFFPRLTRGDAWLIGGLAASALAVAPFDRRGDAWARQPGVRTNGTLRTLSAVGDVSGGYGGMAVGPVTYLVGRARGDSSLSVIGLRTTEAVFVGGVAVTAIKILTGRARPYASPDGSPTHWDFLGGISGDNARWSFPSGHATVASAVAVTLAGEWRRQGLRGWRTVGPPLVTSLAALVAGSRVRDRKHWFSDVAAGAALGTASALIVRRWHDARPVNWIDRAFLPRTAR